MAWYDGILSPLGGGTPGAGGGGILSPMFADRQDSITAMGLGLLSGKNNAEGFEGAMQGFAQGRRSDLIRRGMDEEKAQKDREAMQIAQMAQKLGLPENSDPQIVRSMFIDRFKRREPRELSFEEREFGKLTPEQQAEYRQRKFLGAPATTDDVREYQFAKGEGYQGDFASWMEQKSRRSGAGQQAAPSGYRVTADGNLEPIPGGPATKDAQIPAEVAGRVALAEEYLKNAPAIEQNISAGGMTGAIDAGAAQLGLGKQGETFRQIQSGVDALRRGLTGAGMPESEAAEYASRYLPQFTDSVPKLMSKHRQLTAELKRFRDMALQGRGGSSSQSPAAQTGSTTPGRVRTYNPATGRLE